MKNDLGNKTRRRKVALSARERNLKDYTRELADFDKSTVEVTVGTTAEKELSKSLAASMKDSLKKLIELTTSEIEILKKRVGTFHD